MKTPLGISVAAAGVLALLSGGVAAADDSGVKPGPGDQAPGFTLPSSKGTRLSLDDYRGQTVVLAFFVKAFTGG